MRPLAARVQEGDTAVGQPRHDSVHVVRPNARVQVHPVLDRLWPGHLPEPEVRVGRFGVWAGAGQEAMPQRRPTPTRTTSLRRPTPNTSGTHADLDRR